MKKFLSMLAISSIITSFVACDDDDPVFEQPTIQIVNTDLEQRAGEMIEVDASVIADAGIRTIIVSVDGGDAQDATGSLVNQTAGIATYEFSVPEDAAEGETYSVSFAVTDNQGRTAVSSTVATITVAEEPAQTIEVNESAGGVGTTTWLGRNTYILNGKIYVNDGQTLTIEPGTVIKGQLGQSETASALIVARGGKIIANGTAEEPIIFTALADDVTRTDDLPKNQRGLWGGVILLGNAFINHANGQTNIEGIVASETDPRSLYGVGANPGAGGKNWPLDNAHNAGELSYISIRHGGTNIGAGNEINGLTMGGVGTGTSIHHIEVFGNDDDGFEWFGGTVNSSYLASVLNQDDAFDWDFGWRAENQFWVAVQEQGFDLSDRGFESDGAHSGNLTAAIFSRPQIYNMTLVGSTAAGTPNTGHKAMFFTENSGGLIHNSIIMGFGEGVDITDNPADSDNSRDRLAAGDLAFKNNIWSGVADNTTAGISNGLAELQTYLDDEANGNEISATPGISFTSSAFTLVPSAGSLALTKSRSPLPSANNGFTYETADFIGAFGTTNWMKGWTAADAYGFLP